MPTISVDSDLECVLHTSSPVVDVAPNPALNPACHIADRIAIFGGFMLVEGFMLVTQQC